MEFPPSPHAVRADRRFLPFGRALLATFLVAVLGAACSRSGEPLAGGPALAVSKQQRAAQEQGTLSREHSVTIDVPETELDSKFHRVVDRCAGEAVHHCTMLQSDLSSGQFPSGLIKLRIDPDAVEDLITYVSGLGKLEHRSTTVEDLADAIQDTQSRLEMLTNYRKQLLALQAKTAANVDAAIKIASELSTVQGNLERAAGEAAYQTKRVSTDVVTLHFSVAEQRAFWRPVREAVRDFMGNLSNGVSQAITAVAYIVPWLLVVVPGLYLLRYLWRRRGR